MGEHCKALKGYWLGALKVDAKPVITFNWYRACIQFLVYTQSWAWFSKLVVAGELLVGIALLLGAFTGINALFALPARCCTMTTAA